MAKKEMTNKVVVENINYPGKTTILDRAPHKAMKEAMLKVLPKKQPALTPDEVYKRVLPLLPENSFPWRREGVVVGQVRPIGP